MFEASSYSQRSEDEARTPPGFLEKGGLSHRSPSSCPIVIIPDLAGKPRARPVSVIIPGAERKADPQSQAVFERMQSDALAFLRATKALKARMRRVKSRFPLPHRGSRFDDRRLISGIINVIWNGLCWRDTPKHCGSHKTIDNCFIVSGLLAAALAGKPIPFADEGRPFTR